MPKRAKRALSAAHPDGAADEDEEEEEEEIERLTSQEAYLFPVLGSATLIGE